MSGRQNAERRAFLPIGDEALDEAAERVALAKDIPTLTPPKPHTGETVAATVTSPRQALPADAVSSTASSDVVEQGASQLDAKQQGSSGFTQIRVRCPDYVGDQLMSEQQRIRRQGQRVTLNYLILRALKKAGYRIEEADLVEDGRRLRS